MSGRKLPFDRFLSDHFGAAGGPEAARVSLRLLVFIRWVAIGGQAATIVVVVGFFGFPMPLEPALAAIAASALFNGLAIRRQAASRVGEREAAVHLAFDVLQLAFLLYLTGGLQNPFAVLMLAPVTVGGTVLSRRRLVALAGLAIGSISLLAVAHEKLPWAGDRPAFPDTYVLAVWLALVLATSFISAYAWSVASGARRLRDAFAATQLALAREQRMSAVGALAAAVAHELGSPLGTIAVVAKELVRELPPGSSYAEDAALLLSQSERCRAILAEMSRRPEEEGDESEPYTRIPLSALVEAAGDSHGRDGVRLLYATAAADGAAEPVVPRHPEILHGLGNLIQNALQFAATEVSVTVHWDARTAGVDIADDGPGYPPHLLGRLGEPYLSGRGVGGEAGGHMGLGIFIAYTLLQRTGARLTFENLPEGGARVAIEWNRATLGQTKSRAEIEG